MNTTHDLQGRSLQDQSPRLRHRHAPVRHRDPHHAAVRCASGARLQGVDHPRARQALVGLRHFGMARLRHRPARGRRLALRHPRVRRRRRVRGRVPWRVPHDRGAASHRLDGGVRGLPRRRGRQHPRVRRGRRRDDDERHRRAHLPGASRWPHRLGHGRWHADLHEPPRGPRRRARPRRLTRGAHVARTRAVAPAPGRMVGRGGETRCRGVRRRRHPDPT